MPSLICFEFKIDRRVLTGLDRPATISMYTKCGEKDSDYGSLGYATEGDEL
jgi:hypothetical protein